MMLAQIVDHYIKNHRKNAEKELQWFKIQKTLKDAVENAGLAKRPSGKRFDHQRRIPQKVLIEAKNRLISNLKRIKEAKNFDELYNEIYSLISDINGIGLLYIYDTALRIGAYLGLEPNKVYLHAGTLQGARNLGISTKNKIIAVHYFPKELQRLKPREIEDCLCIYKEKF